MVLIKQVIVCVNILTFNINCSYSYWLYTVLLLCGDIHPCPGPEFSSSIDSHNEFNVFKKRGLHFIYINIPSLLPKLDKLHLIARETNAACIAISNTWLDDIVFDSELSILNYNNHRRDRTRHGGGVCLYIRSDIAFNTREELQHQDLDSLWIELLLPKTKPILLAATYGQPKQNDFYTILERTLHEQYTF